MSTTNGENSSSSSLEYMTGIHYDTSLLKKSLLGTCLFFLVMLWVVFPSGDNSGSGLSDKDDLVIKEFKQPPPPKQKPKTRKIRIKRESAVIPDPDPDEPEPTQQYAWADDEQDPMDEDAWVFVPDGRGPIFADGIKVKKPECYQKPLPLYPDLARKAKKKGVVVLQVVWDTNGNITNAKVLQSPGKQFGFDDAAIEAVKNWKCYPATVGGRKVEIYGTVTVNFILNN
jgi:protein TonB